MEDLVPKKVGKEAILEKKRIENKKINGAKDETGIDDYDEFGGEMDSFKMAKLREERFKAKK